MSTSPPDQRPQPAASCGLERKPARQRKLLSRPVIVAGLLAMLMMPPLVVAVLLVTATEPWEFEGRGLNHFLLVRGTRLDKLGLVAPIGAPPQYTIRWDEGTFPGWSRVDYVSGATADDVVAHYAERCGDMGFTVTERQSRPWPLHEVELACEIERYLDVEVSARQTGSDRCANVVVRVWGRE
jgi:hypothetical protein